MLTYDLFRDATTSLHNLEQRMHQAATSIHYTTNKIKVLEDLIKENEQDHQEYHGKTDDLDEQTEKEEAQEEH